jgi:hypothetical protein
LVFFESNANADSELPYPLRRVRKMLLMRVVGLTTSDNRPTTFSQDEL